MGKASKLILGVIGLGLLVLTINDGYRCITKGKKEKPSEVMFTHKPYTDKMCEYCHNKINSYEWKSDFCLTCHTKKFDEFSKDYKHAPAIEDCTLCHNPHESRFEYLLKKESKDLCLTCHTSDLKGNKIHSNLTKNCIECHDPHASEYALLLKKGGHDVCLLCHTQEEYNQKRLNKKDITIKECKSCHDKNDLSGDCCEKEE